MRIQTLDGLWRIAKDPQNQGRALGYTTCAPYDAAPLTVPGIIQDAFPFYDGVAWYYRVFDAQVEAIPLGRRILRFLSVDYFAEVWLNGVRLGAHEDGEEPFEFDVTDTLKAGDNLLAVRVICPWEEPIDGFVLNETPHRNKQNLHACPGMSQNAGGIINSVTLESAPAVRIKSVFVKPDWQSGAVEARLTVQNALTEPVKADCTLRVGTVIGGAHLMTERACVEVAPGLSEHTICFRVQAHRLWSVKDPYLYTLGVSLEALSQAHDQTVRFGFRDFRVKNGYFMLNGERVWLKCAHTGNCFPVGSLVPKDHDLMYRDLVFAKSMGFNAVRFISSLPLPIQLDYCDELGLMVYEEPFAAWLLAEGEHMRPRYEKSADNMVLRDRNHPCVTIYGLLNETQKTSVYECAKAYLPRLRAMDDTRLVILSSGRFDGEAAVGSLANPGSARWQYEWGNECEGNTAIREPDDYAEYPGPYVKQMGDIHVYPQVPQSERDTNFLRTVGHDSKPIFVSEYGIGSQPNFIQEYRNFEAIGRPDAEDATMYRHMIDGLYADWTHYDLTDSFLFPEDFLVASIRANARERQQTFDCVRANPKVCGFNLTGLLDHATCGEGLWTLWREFKPGLADAVREGFAPLRWALFAKRTVYAGAPVRIEAVLCNEDVLKPGVYPVRMRLKGKHGVIWEKTRDVTLAEKGYGDMPPLAVRAFDETFSIAEPGDYELGVTMLSGGAPLGGRFTISVLATAGALGASVYAFGLSDGAEQWLDERHVTRLDTARSRSKALVLVGGAVTAAQWQTIYRLVASGCPAFFLRPEAFANGENATAWLPLEQPGKCLYYRGWLYHLDNVYKAHPIFEGLGDGGLLQSEFYGSVYPKFLFEGIEKPDSSLCVALGGGQMRDNGYASGLSLGEFGFGHGKLVLNGFEIEQNLGRHPTADRLMENILRHYACEGGLMDPDKVALQRVEQLPR